MPFTRVIDYFNTLMAELMETNFNADCRGKGRMFCLGIGFQTGCLLIHLIFEIGLWISSAKPCSYVE